VVQRIPQQRGINRTGRDDGDLVSGLGGMIRKLDRNPLSASLGKGREHMNYLHTPVPMFCC